MLNFSQNNIWIFPENIHSRWFCWYSSFCVSYLNM